MISIHENIITKKANICHGLGCLIVYIFDFVDSFVPVIDLSKSFVTCLIVDHYWY